MPNRIIKESINESKGLGECSPYAQDLFKRLVTYADDYGRFNPDPEIMRARLFARELESVDELEIDDWLLELASVDKIRFYRAQSNRGQTVFGHLTGWEKHQRVRNSRAKFPDPEEIINDWAIKRAIHISLKIAVYERDQFTCQECHHCFAIEGLSTKHAFRLLSGVLHVDHIVPVLQGGRATLENLRLLCAGCNKKRKRRFNFEELSLLPRVAASCGELRPVSNPILSNSESGGESEGGGEPPQPPPPQKSASNNSSNGNKPTAPIKNEQTGEPVQVLKYRLITNETPPPENWEKITNAIGEKSVDDLKPYFSQWMTISKNRNNLAWLLEWAASGRPATDFGAGSPKSKPSTNGRKQTSAEDPRWAERERKRNAGKP